MNEKTVNPQISIQRNVTIRRGIIALLEREKQSSRQISIEIGISEKEVFEHLEHIRKSAGRAFVLIPAKCRKCNFIFEKRERLKKPGKCPLCHDESIEAPRYKINR